MVPYVRKSFVKHFLEGRKYIGGNDKFDELTKENKDKIKAMMSEWSIDDKERYLSACDGNENVYKYAMEMTEKEVYQAVEGLFHNLNSLQSRSGNQLPFSSVNYGTCTSHEGRMVIKAMLDVAIEGVGPLHKTSVFPCVIFQSMKCVNQKPGDPNYDLFRLALKSTALRLYPNYANVDWSGNAGYDINDPRTYFSTINYCGLCW